MKKYDLLFITTFINGCYIYEMLESIFDNNSSLLLKIIVVSQNNELPLKERFDSTSNIDLEFINLDKSVPLSVARNISIKFIIDNNIFFDYIMFPDDDSTFDKEFFVNFKSTINSNTLIDVYCTNSYELYKNNKYKHGQILNYMNYDASMSVNMIIDFTTFHLVGLFDENMGVGCYYGAGEDADYFIRCCKLCESGFIYNKNIWNYHPKSTLKYKDMTLKRTILQFKKYGKGAMYLFNKHKMYDQSLKYILYGFLGALNALINFDFKLSIARMFAVYYRSSTFIYLLIHNED